jgi:hypothetical protein
MAIQYNSDYDLTIPFSDVSYPVSLTAGSEQVITIPGIDTSRYSMRLNYNATSNVFVRLNNTVTVPAANSADLVQYSEYRAGDDGSQRYVNGGNTVHFITPDATAYVGVSLRQLET